MARRREIKGIAFSIADKFISRYNSIDGYWAIGKLYAHTLDHKTTLFTYDVISDTCSPKFHAFEKISKPYYDFLIQQGEERGLIIVSAEIAMKFESEFVPRYRQNTNFLKYMEKVQARYFICEVTLEDDRGTKWLGESKGWCWPHESDKESRRLEEWQDVRWKGLLVR